MTVLDHYQAMSHLPELIERAKAGEEIVITSRDGKTGVRLLPVPVELVEDPNPLPRVPGMLKGKLWVSPDFDEWPEDMAKALGMID